jgi:hypothetical protein
MNRRTVLKNTALFMGGTFAAASLPGLISSCQADPQMGFKPIFLKNKEASTLEALVDRIIPETDTPGAREAGVPGFIDIMLSEYFPQKEREFFVDGLKKIDEKAKSVHNKSFAHLQTEQMDAILKGLENSVSRGNSEKPEFFDMVREITIYAFFTSEIGATKALNFDPVPENYQGCIDVNLVGKTWAL